MISLPSLSVKSKRVRALTAGTFFLLIVPQKIQSIEPITLTAGLVVGLYGLGELITYALKDYIKPVKSKCPFDPNCVDCVKKRAEALKLLPAPAPAPIKTTATQVPSQAVYNVTHYHNHTTTNITAADKNKIIITPEKARAAAVPVPPPATAQTMHTSQTVEPPQPPVQPVPIESPEIEITPGTNDQYNLLATLIHERIQDLYKNHYGKVGMATAATGYLYILYSISSLQRYLTDPKRISFWFSEYDLNKLLLIDLDRMQELIIQEFMHTYHVSDQKSLKPAVSNFLQDIETELDYLDRYQTLAGRIDTASSLTEKCCSPFCDVARTVIPFAGLVLDHIPVVSISNLFFINSTLTTTIQERISRIHYYKNIFLQSTIVI